MRLMFSKTKGATTNFLFAAFGRIIKFDQIDLHEIIRPNPYYPVFLFSKWDWVDAQYALELLPVPEVDPQDSSNPVSKPTPRYENG